VFNNLLCLTYNTGGGRKREHYNMWKPKTYKSYKWIVQDPEYRGGSLRVYPDDIDISLVLKCFSAGMSQEDIEQQYPFKLRPEVLAEIFALSADLIEKESSEKKMAS
jgi:uncharacterized protein (DUF433 family)